MQTVKFKNKEYNLLHQTSPSNALEERYYQIAEREGRKYFLKHWINRHVHKGLTELLLHTKLRHPHISPLLDFELDTPKQDLCLMFNYYPYSNLLNATSISKSDFNVIGCQLNMTIDYLKEEGVITYHEDCETTRYYEQIGHNVIYNEPKSMWDFGLSNIIWDQNNKQIYLIDFERHDQPWPSIYDQTMSWLADLVGKDE